MVKRKSDTEALEHAANAATAAGMTYGQWQQEKYRAEHEESRSRLRESQPVYHEEINEYLCPKCGKRLVKYKNCADCGKVIIWRKGKLK